MMMIISGVYEMIKFIFILDEAIINTSHGVIAIILRGDEISIVVIVRLIIHEAGNLLWFCCDECVPRIR